MGRSIGVVLSNRKSHLFNDNTPRARSRASRFLSLLYSNHRLAASVGIHFDERARRPIEMGRYPFEFVPVHCVSLLPFYAPMG